MCILWEIINVIDLKIVSVIECWICVMRIPCESSTKLVEIGGESLQMLLW